MENQHLNENIELNQVGTVVVNKRAGQSRDDHELKDNSGLVRSFWISSTLETFTKESRIVSAKTANSRGPNGALSPQNRKPLEELATEGGEV